MSALGKYRLSSLILVMFLSAAVVAQELPGIAVYVTGDIPGNKKRALGSKMLSVFSESGRYEGIERFNSFFNELEKEHEKHRGSEMGDTQISAFARKFGVRYVCVADITPASDGYQVAARIIDVETAVFAQYSESSSPLQTMNDLEQVSQKLVSTMLGELSAPQPEPVVMETRPAAESISQTMAEPDRQPIKPTFWLGLGLDVTGVGLVGYGIYQDRKAKNYIKDDKYKKSENAETKRNIAYIVGGAALLGGISVHIFF